MKLRIFEKEIYIPVGLVLHYTRRRELNGLLKYLEARYEHAIGDVACGDGYVTRRFAGKVGPVFGNDLNLDRITEAHRARSTNSYFVVSSAEALPWRDGSLDRLISVCALEHFNNDKLALFEMRRVLRNGGILALSVDSLNVPGISEDYRQWHSKQFSVNNYYNLPKLKDRLEKAGFMLTDWHFLVNSKLSDRIIRYLQRRRKLGFLIYPAAYPLTLLFDKMEKQKDRGHKLLVRAQAI